MPDPYDLARFVDAQRDVYDQVLRELEQGRKRTHWMWFVFPQCAGLGSSAMARRYAIGGLDEARAYLGHEVLGRRLRACTTAANAAAGRSAYEVFGPPDDLKFRSSMTLFARAAPEVAAFTTALAAFFGGEEDPRTVEILTRGWRF